MDTEQALQTAETLLSPWAATVERPTPERLDVVLSPTDLLAATAAITQAGWGYLAAITGLDLGPEAGQIEVLYHFCQGAAVVTLRLQTPRDSAEVDSVCGLIPSASFFERELSEMLGVTVVNTPDPERLFLPENWPEGVYPLRKDFQPQSSNP